LTNILEPIIQQVVQNELKKLSMTPNHIQDMNQAQWQSFIQETSGSWEDMPFAEEIRKGWDTFSERESC
jgi:hypothetical protein